VPVLNCGLFVFFRFFKWAEVKVWTQHCSSSCDGLEPLAEKKQPNELLELLQRRTWGIATAKCRWPPICGLVAAGDLVAPWMENELPSKHEHLGR
jgi:hypothetical protein